MKIRVAPWALVCLLAPVFAQATIGTAERACRRDLDASARSRAIVDTLDDNRALSFPIRIRRRVLREGVRLLEAAGELEASLLTALENEGAPTAAAEGSDVFQRLFARELAIRARTSRVRTKELVPDTRAWLSESIQLWNRRGFQPRMTRHIVKAESILKLMPLVHHPMARYQLLTYLPSETATTRMQRALCAFYLGVVEEGTADTTDALRAESAEERAENLRQARTCLARQ